ncbi:pyridoxamine 5'-phosphate oxidase family protein [Herbiconiux sp. VKM Ac-1786]|uniref:pyridoxamine 5'-phosphate oxidase family protein n=1 Tax=Herbiconiux sp. VKM Ac-1786 TaxID=2783824 RepID=UPI00188D88EC|nr:pyridoxamine 5'-phosphate oxidase family protein [Herbiconiux sp. VKM Ac-1786]MBF4571951.1 pyridoxamine 5'-phosphate oxidase family protein [Herbiconiux sp. VKM Ac-1786]
MNWTTRPHEIHAEDVVETLDPEECWRLLATTELGRLAVSDDQGADIFPINHLVTDRLVYFRSAPGTKIVRLTERPGVAFETDGTENRQRWSVVLRGTARRLSIDTDIQTSGVDELHTFTRSTKWNYFVITPVTITGVRFTTQPDHRTRKDHS